MKRRQISEREEREARERAADHRSELPADLRAREAKRRGGDVTDVTDATDTVTSVEEAAAETTDEEPASESSVRSS